MSDPATPPVTPPPAPAPDKPVPPSLEHTPDELIPEQWRGKVAEFRDEVKGWRLKAKEMEMKAQEAAEKAAAAEMTASQSLQAQQAATDRMMRAELKAAATAAGMVDLDGLKMADLSTVKLNDQGELEGAAELMEALKVAKPYLFKEVKSTSSTATPPAAAGKSTFRELSAEQQQATLRKMGLPI